MKSTAIHSRLSTCLSNSTRALLTLSLAFLCTPNLQASELVVASSPEIRTLDPALAYEWENYQITSTIGAGLYRWDVNKAEPRPDLAKSVEILDNGKLLIFSLHEDIKFQNGRDITAHDFVFSFNRILHPKTKSPFAGFYTNVVGAAEYSAGKQASISGIRAIDEHTLEMRLLRPDASILTVLSLSFGFVVPAEEVDKPEFDQMPVGAGPYYVLSRDSEELILAKSTYYKRGNPRSVDRIVMKLNSDRGGSNLLNIERGLIHFSEFHRPTERSTRYAEDEFYSHLVKQINELSTIFFAMNVQSDVLKDHRVRQALNYGIDQQTIVDSYVGGGILAAKQILPPSLSADPDRPDAYPYDVSKAKDLLRQAGYQDGFEIKLLSQESKLNRKMIDQMAAQLLQLGVVLNPEYVSTDQFLAKVAAGQIYDLYYSDGMAWIADYPDPSNFFFPLFTRESIKNGFNWSGFDSAALHEKALQINAMIGSEFDQQRALAWDNLFAELHSEHTPWVPLFHRSRLTLLSSDVRGYEQILKHGVSCYIFENLWVEQ